MKVKLVVSYFFISFFIFVIVGDLIDHSIKATFYNAVFRRTGQSPRQDFIDIQNILLIGRFIRLFLSVISAYFLVSYLMKSLHKTDELQKNFASTVSHQLRTPLAVMQNGLEVALHKKEKLSHEKFVEVLQDNLEETRRLSDIINFLLDFSKINSRRKALLMSKVSLYEIAKDAKKLLSKLSENRGIKVLIENEVDGIVRGNAVALHELMVNLLKNAITYTNSGGWVKVQIKNELNKVCLIVSDNGMGIDKNDLEHVFEPFYQGTAGRSSEARGGVGLGLAIVQEIVHLHKAAISVESETNKGTTFRVCFEGV